MTAPKSRRTRRSPRRKAGRTPSAKTERKIRFRLTVEAQEMIVDYTPDWSEGEFAYGHFEFNSPFEPPRKIPISETGYRSQFAPMEEIALYESPEEYARAYVLCVLDAGRKTKRGDQLSLF